MPNEDKINETERLIAEAVIKLRCHSSAIVDSALSLARSARNSRPSSIQAMRAVRPGEPVPAGEITGRFAAYR